ncbi:MAG: Peptidoglycan glycosyltransferase [Firmicutes bacterium]|nr:Peptidoglycan glycosyltransferase [Bacillota bacterium]
MSMEGRIYKIRFLFFGLCLALFSRLIYLQLIEGPQLTVEGLSGRVQELPVEVPRGEIVDRNGVPLTNTTVQYNIAIFPNQIGSIEKASNILAEYTGQEPVKIAAEIRANHRPFKLPWSIDAGLAAQLNRLRMPGVVAMVERVRYDQSSMAAHVIGYINSADNRGVSGIEGKYDDFLRTGQSTYLAAIVDAGQQIIPGLGYKKLNYRADVPPNNIVLTLDISIQKIVEEVLDKSQVSGAVVVLRPSTGEVLAMASRPNFNPNYVGTYLDKVHSPLVNKAIAAYQPGSVFKLVLAAAALEEGIVKPDDTFYDPGYIDVEGHRFKGWNFESGGNGTITFQQAIAYSSNPVCISVGLKLGSDKLLKYAKLMGFGEKTGIELESEGTGNLPTSDSTFAGDMANLSIGQGSLEATPLQIANLVSTIVNNGVKVEPYLVNRMTTPDGYIIKKYNHRNNQMVLSAETAAKIRAMLVMTTRNGTGQAAYVEQVGSAGKTGTAETGRHNATGQSINHAWFAGYAPLENPEIVVVVFVEDGMSGSEVAAPLFHDIVSRVLAKTS